MTDRREIPVVVSQLKCDEIGNSLKSQLQSDCCWTDKSTDILLSGPIVLFEFHRLLSAVRRLFKEDIILNPVHAFCPVCGKVLKLKRANCIIRVSLHITAAHPGSEEYVEKLRLLEDHSFFNNTEYKLPVTADKTHEYFAFKLPQSLQTGDIHYLSFWLNILLKNNIIEPGSLCFQEVDAFIDMCQRFPRPTPPRWKFWPTLCGYVERLNAGFSRLSHKFYLGSHIIDKSCKSRTATIEDLKKFVSSVNHAGPALSTVSTWKPPLVLESSTHFLEIALHIKTLMAIPDSRPVSVQNEHVVRLAECFIRIEVFILTVHFFNRNI